MSGAENEAERAHMKLDITEELHRPCSKICPANSLNRSAVFFAGHNVSGGKDGTKRARMELDKTKSFIGCVQKFVHKFFGL